MTRPDVAAAMQVQREVARRVRCEDDLGPVRRVAGVDVSTERFGETGWAAIVVLEAPDWRVVEIAGASAPLEFPYVPGLLSFREAPIVIAAYERLKMPPDLLVVDGQGRAHPRRCGIACHLGVTLDRPSLGCAKSILVGGHPEPGPERGDRAPLVDRGEVVGWALRTRARVNPVYVSCGHRLSDETAIAWVLRLGKGYRLPEPTRLAHVAANRLRTLGEASLP